MIQNKEAELAHAKKILHHPEFYWNSATVAGRKGSLRRAEWVMKASHFVPGKKVLEVGCGTGFFSEVFVKSGVQLFAIDISSELVNMAKKKELSADFRVCDVEALPFDNDLFDAVVGIRVLHHLNMEGAFREIIRVLKPGGRIAFCEPNMLNPQIMIQKNVPWIKKLMGDTPDETAFFKKKLRKFLVQKGFQNIYIKPFDFLHPWTPAFMVPLVEKSGEWMERIPVIREIAGSLAISAELHVI